MNSLKPTEISGKPAQVWGNFYLPASGKIAVKIAGDSLQATISGGLETREAHIRIANLDSYEIVESPLYSLLSIGVFFVLLGLASLTSNFIFAVILLGLGGAGVVFAFILRNKLLVFYSLRYTLPLYMQKSMNRGADSTYRQFASQVLAVARQQQPQPSRPLPPPPPKSRSGE